MNMYFSNKSYKYIMAIIVYACFNVVTVEAQSFTCDAPNGHKCWFVAVNGDDSDDGSLTSPFETVQHAVDEMSGGDIIYLRGGTYRQGHIHLTAGKNGSSDAWSTIKSYPGEWAVLDGENDLANSLSGACVIGSPDQSLSYWKFERLEIMGGRTADGRVAGGFRANDGPFWFRYVYIHDNYATVDPGSDGVNGGLRGKQWRDSIVEYSVFENNGALSGGGHNIGDINITSDYVENPEDVNISEALRNNIYRYNLFNGSLLGIKHKNSQWLSLNHQGTHTTHEELGDKIHHNIFLNNEVYAIDARQDFVQIYNNIFINADQVSVGEAYSDDREPFFAVVYNNHFVGTRLGYHHSGNAGGDNSSYSPPLIGRFYGYNNIIESVGQPSDGLRDINFYFTYSGWDIDDGDVNMNNIEFENNLLLGRSDSDEYIVIGDNEDIYSTNEFLSSGYSSVFYQKEDTIFSSIENYSVDSSYRLNNIMTIGDGGIGKPHPYLPKVVLPIYVGAVNPNDDAWARGVYDLQNIQNLRNASSGDPAWVEGSTAPESPTVTNFAPSSASSNP